MSSEKFCLRWNDFESNISSAFIELREDKDFFDVTLACDDEQIQAHKVILAACSPFFRNILRRNPHQHPLLYMKGVKYSDMQGVLNFMYHGEVNIAQEELNSFLSVAEDLKVKGLTQNQPSSKQTTGRQQDTREHSVPNNKYHQRSSVREHAPPVKQPSYPPPVVQDDDIQEVVPIKSEPQQQPLAPPEPQSQVYTTDQGQAVATYQEETGYEDYGDYQDQMYSETDNTMDLSMSMHGTQAGKELIDAKATISEYLEKCPEFGSRAWKCKVCGKINSDNSSARKHVENIHFPGMCSYTCKYCGKVFNARNNMYVHISQHHKNS